MKRPFPAVATLLLTAVLAPVAPAETYTVPAGRSPIPAEGEHFTTPIPARRLVPTERETPAPSLANTVPWSRAGAHVGQTLTVSGRVVSTRDLGNLTFVNFTEDRSAFYVVVFRDAYRQFPRPPAEYLRGQTIQVTGRIKLHRDRPQIEVRHASQVKVMPQ